MTPLDKLSRREMLAALGLLPLLSASAAVPVSEVRKRGNTLVAYFSRTGNTRVIAGQIHRALGTDLFEIQPAAPYPEDYEETVEQARRERDRGYEPPLRARVSEIGAYEIVFLGFPIWGETAPPVIRSFLTEHDLSGKTVMPFITHGGYGLGSSLALLRAHAPRARLVEGLTMQADQERQTLTSVTRWLGDVRARK